MSDFRKMERSRGTPYFFLYKIVLLFVDSDMSKWWSDDGIQEVIMSETPSPCQPKKDFVKPFPSIIPTSVQLI